MFWIGKWSKLKRNNFQSFYLSNSFFIILYSDHRPDGGIHAREELVQNEKKSEILHFHNFTKKTPKLKILICIFVKYFLWTFPWVDLSSRSDLSSKCIVDIVYNSIFIFQPIFIRICFAMKGWCLSMTGTLCPSLIQTVTPSPTTRGSGNTFTPGPGDLRIRYILM